MVRIKGTTIGKEQMGAWLVPIQYSEEYMRAIYPEKLPSKFRSKIFHLPKAGHEVDCPVVGAKKADNVPSGKWSATYEWPEIKPPEVVPHEAGQGAKATFLNAIEALKDAFTADIQKHIETHTVEDQIVIAAMAVVIGFKYEQIG